MTREMIENDIFEFIKSDYEKFVLELKTNGNYDFFKTLDNFTQRMAFLKSNYSYGIESYRDRVYANIYGSYRFLKSFTFENYENAIKTGYYYPVDIDKHIKANPIFGLTDNKTQELILSKTIFKDFKNVVENQVKKTVSDAITKVMFGMRW